MAFNIAKATSQRAFMDLNTRIFIFLNNFARQNSVLDILGIFLAQYAIFIFAWILIYYLRKDKKIFFSLAAAAISAVIIVMVIKKIFFVPRPFLQEGVRLLIEHRADSAFPSKHSAVAFAVACAVFLERRKPGAVLLALSFLVALSRVMVGVHYPADVFAGALIGMGSAGITHKLFRIKKQNNL